MQPQASNRPVDSLAKLMGPGLPGMALHYRYVPLDALKDYTRKMGHLP